MCFNKHANLSRLKKCFWFGNVTRCLQGEIAFGRTIKYSEEIVVRTRHDSRIITAPTTFELVEDTVIFVQ